MNDPKTLADRRIAGVIMDLLLTWLSALPCTTILG
jgi:hypothetical protein